MAEKGKYHGQRLKARDVLRLYAAGERDFRGTILRGQNFCGAELSGADFSGADIRSARFVDATLRGVRFCGVKCGLQWQKSIAQSILISILASLVGAFQGLALAIVGWAFFAERQEDINLTVGFAALFIVMSAVYGIMRYGFTLLSLQIGILGLTIAYTTTAIFSPINITGITSVNLIFVGLLIHASLTACTDFKVVLLTFLIIISAALSLFLDADINLENIDFYITTIVITIIVLDTLIILFLNIYFRQRIKIDDPKFKNLRSISLSISTLLGTCFSGADLTNTYFTQADLINTNFARSRKRETTFTNARWHYANNLEYSRLGNSNLQNSRLRDLLTSLDGSNQDFTNANLAGTNLAEAQLQGAILKWTNLNRANLSHAQLHQASLTEASCVGTDFTNAQLTGATLEAWNIDDTTVLKDIDCDFVFLREKADAKGNRERLPHNPDKIFEPGDFEKYFKEVMDEVKLLIRGGVDPQAFKTAFQALIYNHDIDPTSVRGFERKGSDVLIRVA